MNAKHRGVVILFLGALSLAPGCGRSAPPPADPERAGQALRATLDAWKNGESVEALQRQDPPVQVIDREWRSGRRLKNYKVGKAEPVGADLRCQVDLTVHGPRGRPVTKRAVYSVGTSPALTVTREEEP
jgi:hypothetical protein